MRVYRRNHGLQQSPCTVKAVLDSIHKFEDTGCTCDQHQSIQPSVHEETVAVVHQTISTVRLASARGVSRILNQPNSTVCKILRCVLTMFPIKFQRVVMLEAGDSQLRLDIHNKFLIRYDEDKAAGVYAFWGHIRRILP